MACCLQGGRPRPRKLVVQSQSKPELLMTKESSGVGCTLNQRAQEHVVLISDVLCLGAEDGCPSSRRESKSPLPLTFCWIQVPSDWMIATHIDEGYLLQSVYSFKCYLFQKVSPIQPRRKVLPGISAFLSSITFPHKISHPYLYFL